MSPRKRAVYEVLYSYIYSAVRICKLSYILIQATQTGRNLSSIKPPLKAYETCPKSNATKLGTESALLLFSTSCT